ncbi:MAG: hypothetical protein ACOYKB_01995 [Succiniclasticum sp.]|jgi:hypothetical protein
MEYLLLLWIVAILLMTRAVTPKAMLYAYGFQALCLFWNAVLFRASGGVQTLQVLPWMAVFFVFVCIAPLAIFWAQWTREKETRRTAAFRPNMVSLCAALAAALCYGILDWQLPFALGRDFLACSAALAAAGLCLLVRARSVSIRLAGCFCLAGALFVAALIFGKLPL